MAIQQRKDDGSGEDGSVMNSENMCVPPTALDGSLSFSAGGADAVLSLSRKID